MARYTGAVCRQCRREGKKLFLKGDRCYSDKCAIDERNKEKRQGAPGQHGQSRKKMSEYGMQLRAKQMTKKFYGVLEGQFHHYFEMAEKMQGKAGENLLTILESRLDNIVYRLGFAASRAQARQLVVHGHFTVNGRKVNIPSYTVKPGDVIKVKEKSTNSPKFKEVKEMSITVPSWVAVDVEKLEGKILSVPTRAEIDTPVAEHLIVELYSK